MIGSSIFLPDYHIGFIGKGNQMHKVRSLSVIGIVLSGILLSGCKKEPPKCGDKETLSLVRNIVVANYGGKAAADLDEKEVEKLLQIETPIADKYEENIKKYSCSADLVVTSEDMGQTWRNSISYIAQLDDNDELFVSVKVPSNMIYPLRGVIVEKDKRLKQQKFNKELALRLKTGIGRAKEEKPENLLNDYNYFEDMQTLNRARASVNGSGFCQGNQEDDFDVDLKDVQRLYRAHHGIDILQFADGKWCLGMVETGE